MQNNKKTGAIILGIDPGYGRLGISILKKECSLDTLIYSECFETSNKDSHHERLLSIGEKLDLIIEKYKPEILAIETLLFSKNTKTALLVAEARGVILLKGAFHKLDVREFNPNQIKLAVTGYGKSDKKQIINMVQKILKIKENNKLDDEYDAIAIALTCSATLLSTNKY